MRTRTKDGSQVSFFHVTKIKSVNNTQLQMMYSFEFSEIVVNIHV